jgi:hypothetical protein
MSTIERCIEQLEAVRDAAADPGAAYVIRSRLERALLSCGRLVAEMSDNSAPVMPGLIATTTARDAAKRLANACNTVHDLTASICRPSESLDARWEDGWCRIASALDQLEAELRCSGQVQAKAC